MLNTMLNFMQAALRRLLGASKSTEQQRREQRRKAFYAAMNEQQPIEHVHFAPFDNRFSHATAMQKLHQLAQQREAGEQW